VPLPVVAQGDGLAEARESYLWGGYSKTAFRHNGHGTRRHGTRPSSACRCPCAWPGGLVRALCPPQYNNSHRVWIWIMGHAGSEGVDDVPLLISCISKMPVQTTHVITPDARLHCGIEGRTIARRSMAMVPRGEGCFRLPPPYSMARSPCHRTMPAPLSPEVARSQPSGPTLINRGTHRASLCRIHHA
jgi:hypothetical protein